MTLLPPLFLDAVAAIGFQRGQKVEFSATGFLFGYLSEPGKTAAENRYTIVLVTNRHVFEGKKSAEIRHNPDGSDVARTFHVDLEDKDGKLLWDAHPDPTVDVAVIPVNYDFMLQEKLKVFFFEQEKHARTLQQYEAEGGSAGDSVFILGFPLGDVGGDRNHVIVRGGVIARMSHVVPGSVQNFLIDGNIFPGNSGGPVICRPEPMGLQGGKVVSTAYLIGMVAAYVPYEDVAVSQQTGRPRVIFQENSGLGSIVPVERIIETVQHALTVHMPPPSPPTP